MSEKHIPSQEQRPPMLADQFIEPFRDIAFPSPSPEETALQSQNIIAFSRAKQENFPSSITSLTYKELRYEIAEVTLAPYTETIDAFADRAAVPAEALKISAAKHMEMAMRYQIYTLGDGLGNRGSVAHKEYLRFMEVAPESLQQGAQNIMDNWLELAKLAASLDTELFHPDKQFTRFPVALSRTIDDFDFLVTNGYDPRSAYNKMVSAPSKPVEKILEEDRERVLIEQQAAQLEEARQRELEQNAAQLAIRLVRPASHSEAFEKTLAEYQSQAGKRPEDQLLAEYVQEAKQGETIGGLTLPQAVRMLDLITADREAQLRFERGITPETPRLTLPILNNKQQRELLLMPKGTIAMPRYNDIEIQLRDPSDPPLQKRPFPKKTQEGDGQIVRMTSLVPQTKKFNSYVTACSVYISPTQHIENPTVRQWKYHVLERAMGEPTIRLGHVVSAILAAARDMNLRHEILIGHTETSRARF